MRIVNRLKRFFVGLACLGVLAPTQLLQAETPQPPEPPVVVKITDVVLEEDRTLHGQVIDSQGAAAIGVRVGLTLDGREIAQLVADQNGRFAVEGLRGGLYVISAGTGAGMFRVWRAGTAPPAASEQVVLRLGDDIVRGQGPLLPWGHPLKTWLVNPYFMAGVVALAVGIPVAIHNSGS